MITTKSKNRNSLIWKIEKNGQYCFLGGTIHLTFPGIEAAKLRLISVFNSGILRYFGETDLDGLSELQQVQIRSKSGLFLNNFSKKQRIRYHNALIKHTGIDLEQMNGMPPLFVVSVITAALMNGEGPSIDEILWRKADTMNIPVSGLESIEEQLEVYESIPIDYQIVQLKKLLSNISKARKNLMKMGIWYVNEDIHSLYKNGKKSLGSIRHLMLNQRNTRMTERIINVLDSNNNPSYITIGAAHLSGEVGLLHQLVCRGCRITPVQFRVQNYLL